MPMYRVAVHLTAVLRVGAQSPEAAEQAVVDGFPIWCAGPLFDRQLYVEALEEVANHDLMPDDIIQVHDGGAIHE